jgi:DNA invertase Pin-like site-specific DNA recombinase
MTAENAARLFRVSSNGQTEENQVPEVDAHCARHGYDVARTFQLHDVSASKGEQESTLEEILADIRAGRYTVVVIAHSSRIDRRDPDVQMWWLLAVRFAGGRIESAREPEFGKATLPGRVMTLLAQEQNHAYIKTLVENTEAGMVKVRANGAVDGMVPWGYAIEGERHNKRAVPTETGRTYVPQIYAKVIEGWSLAAVCRWLDAEGVPTPRAGMRGKVAARWWPRTVQRVIMNPAYKGMRSRLTGTRLEWKATPTHRCEAIVDAGTWHAAQDALRLPPKVQAAPAGRPAKRPPMLNRVLFCGNPDCPGGGEWPMYRITPGPGTDHVYYRCYGRGAARAGCGTYVRLALADEAVDRLITATCTDPVIIYTRIPGNADALDAQLEDIDTQLEELPRLRLAYAEEDAMRADLRRRREAIEQTERTADTYGRAPAGYTHAERWAQLADTERGAWLARHGFRVTASRTDVTVTQADPVTDRLRREHIAITPARRARSDGGRPLGPRRGPKVA